ncbi:ATPase [Alphaproteobacteria bacterium]|nr:ATPase [Alphaproteobacteria bacterium]
MKKFYKSAESKPVEGGYGVFLDGRPLRTNAKKPLVLPTDALAAAIAEEWRVQDEKIKPQTMPIMTLASTAIDLIAEDRDGKVAEISKYGETDLICYYADAPKDLVKTQRSTWEPLHAWSNDELNAPLISTDSIIAVPQADASLVNLKNRVDAMSHWQIAVMQELVSITGSLVIALALDAQHLSPEQAIEASQLEENFQAENWGEDEEEAEVRGQKSQDLHSAVNFLRLLNK